ncbi:MAG: hypothetical protein N4A36_02770 [Candidatus Gracilibacteria bacterium]|jgi:hypothetical protein|nr:hypothetical protein [Candidatus Gracilibacteria bacterium]
MSFNPPSKRHAVDLFKTPEVNEACLLTQDKDLGQFVLNLHNSLDYAATLALMSYFYERVVPVRNRAARSILLKSNFDEFELTDHFIEDLYGTLELVLVIHQIKILINNSFASSELLEVLMDTEKKRPIN